MGGILAKKIIYTMKKSLKILLARIADIKAQFGTLTDQRVLSQHFGRAEWLESPELNEGDLRVLRRAIETGIVDSPEFKPPNGYDVLGFLIALREHQQAQFNSRVDTQEEELIKLCAEMWTRQLNLFKGDKAKAAENIKIMLGGKVTPEFKTRLNKAYKLARKWDLSNQQAKSI